MSVDVHAERDDVVKALAEPLRWRIVELLADEELCVCHLVEELGVAQPLVSHHLKTLRAAGLVTSTRYRQWVLLPPPARRLEALTQRLVHLGSRAADATRRPCT
jgi:ArsR family transcriptional regulator